VFGLNYNIGSYGKILAHPGNEKKPILSSESSSCISSRGEYFFPGKDAAARSVFQISSYDANKPGWGCTPDSEFAALEKNPAVMGEFVWTGFDYIGEPTPYNKNAPSASSYFGIVDLCGFKKDRFYSYQAHWRPEFPMAHIFPHWNWPERVGQVTPVHVYTSGDEAELFVNGTSAGRQKKEPFEYRLVWDKVEYQPGGLKVVAYKGGKEWAKDEVKTTGPAAKLLLSADRTGIRADGLDLSYVTVVVADKDGLMVPRANHLVTFSISGPGDVVAVGNGDATSHEPYQAMQRKAFNGLCLAIVRSKTGEAGKVTLKAESNGLLAAEVVIETR
jgi:beta-galactosidase